MRENTKTRTFCKCSLSIRLDYATRSTEYSKSFIPAVYTYPRKYTDIYGFRKFHARCKRSCRLAAIASQSFSVPRADTSLFCDTLSFFLCFRLIRRTCRENDIVYTIQAIVDMYRFFFFSVAYCLTP